MNSLGSERVAIVGVVNPADQATTAASTAWVDVSKFARLVGVLLGGAITGTLDAKFQQATASDGTGVKDVTGAAITQVANDEDGGQQIINLRHDQMDIDGGFRYARLTVTPTGGTTNLAAAIVLGFDPRHTPTSGDDLASVSEIV